MGGGPSGSLTDYRTQPEARALKIVRPPTLLAKGDLDGWETHLRTLTLNPIAS